MLTSQARESLRGVETVIIDEVHAVAGTKRGAHLAVSLERLDSLLPQPAQRIGLSATVRPLEEVARFLGGTAPVEIVAPPSQKEWDLEVVVPVEDMTAPDEYDEDSEDPQRAQSIWPHVEERVVDLVEAAPLDHRLRQLPPPRRAAHRPPQRDRHRAAGAATAQEAAGPPAQLMAQSGASGGAETVIARAHHGSVSKEQRALIEDDLKRGRLPCVVATSSLELGIDMGAVDLVVQIESPPSVASALQRVGRAGHQVGEVSRGVLFPKHRGDLAQTAVAVERMRTGAIESLRVPANPLDVLAQQVVAATALDAWQADELFALVKRSAPFTAAAALGVRRHARPAQRPLPLRRVRRAAPADRLGPGHRHPDRPARRPAARGDQRRHDPRPRPVRRLPGRRRGPANKGGRRVGELDEEMVYESRVGDVFALGATSWRIEDITHDRVLVTPAPGIPGRLPFWKGDALGRPAELGAAIGSFTRELGSLPRDRAVERAREGGLDEFAAGNLVTYLRRAGRGHQRAAQRPHPAGRAVPRRARRLAAGAALAVRHPGPRAVGARDQRPAARALRRRRPGRGLRRRHRDPHPRHRRRAPRRRRGGVRRRRDRGPGHPGGRRLGALRRPLPRVRRARPAAPPPRPRPALAAVAAAAAVGGPARGGRRSTPPSRSSSRRCASASRTSTTCRRWWR